jgi:hypothetical protein
MHSSNQTIARNQLVGTLASLRESYGADAKLFDLPKAEFDDSASYVALALKAAGFFDGARTVVNNYNWWSMTTADFSAQVLANFDDCAE